MLRDILEVMKRFTFDLLLLEYAKIPKASIDVDEKIITQAEIKKLTVKSQDSINSTRKLPKNLEFAKDLIKLGQHLGHGAYGQVKTGFLNGEQIAVKMLFPGSAECFEREIKILRYFEFLS